MPTEAIYQHRRRWRKKEPRQFIFQFAHDPRKNIPITTVTRSEEISLLPWTTAIRCLLFGTYRASRNYTRDIQNQSACAEKLTNCTPRHFAREGIYVPIERERENHRVGFARSLGRSSALTKTNKFFNWSAEEKPSLSFSFFSLSNLSSRALYSSAEY